MSQQYSHKNNLLLDRESCVIYRHPNVKAEKKFTLIDYLSGAIDYFADVAGQTNEEEIQSRITSARRRIEKIFERQNESTSNTVNEQLYNSMKLSDNIGPHTVTVQKDPSGVTVYYRDKFEAKNSIIKLSKNQENVDKKDKIHKCARGVRKEHAPYKPNKFHKWRYRKGTIQFSIKQNKDTIYLGINSSMNKSIKEILFDQISKPLYRATFKQQ